MEIEFLLRPQQREIIDNLNRFNVVVAHRRMGKTWLAIVWLLKTIHECDKKNAQGFYYAPTFSQAKRVAWKYLRDFTEHLTGATYNESELRINWMDKMIQLGSADNPDASRGIYADAVILDEPAQMPTRLFSEILRPALSDRKGSMMMIGTPQGRRGLYFDSYQLAENDPLWARFMYKASETGIIDPEELAAARRSQTRAEYMQEWECDFSAAVRGAYFGEAMSKIEAEQIGVYKHDINQPVYAAFDLGINDATAIWMAQRQNNAWTFINYKEFTNSGLADIVRWMHEQPYTWGKVVFPHDVQVRSLSTGQTRLATLQGLGVDAVVAPQLPVIDGIDTARAMIPRCHFDLANCRDGIEALRQYRSDWVDTKGRDVLQLRPLHDWSSHGADAFRYLAVSEHLLSSTWSDIDYSAMDGNNYAVR